MQTKDFKDNVSKISELLSELKLNDFSVMVDIATYFNCKGKLSPKTKLAFAKSLQSYIVSKLGLQRSKKLSDILADLVAKFTLQLVQKGIKPKNFTADPTKFPELTKLYTQIEILSQLVELIDSTITELVKKQCINDLITILQDFRAKVNELVTKFNQVEPEVHEKDNDKKLTSK